MIMIRRLTSVGQMSVTKYIHTSTQEQPAWFPVVATRPLRPLTQHIFPFACLPFFHPFVQRRDGLKMSSRVLENERTRC